MRLSSVQLHSRCAEGTGSQLEMWARLRTQNDLDAALDEANECGQHVLHIDVTGHRSLRLFDSLLGLVDLAAAVAFTLCAFLSFRQAPDSDAARFAAQLASVGLLANTLPLGAAACFEPAAFSAWPLFLLSPLSLEVGRIPRRSVRLISQGPVINSAGTAACFVHRPAQRTERAQSHDFARGGLTAAAAVALRIAPHYAGATPRLPQLVVVVEHGTAAALPRARHAHCSRRQPLGRAIARKSARRRVRRTSSQTSPSRPPSTARSPRCRRLACFLTQPVPV